MLKRPMLASPAKEQELRVLKWPKLISPKLDGVRALCVRIDGKPVLVSRKLLPIPNPYCQKLFAREEFVGLDGELCVGAITEKNLMQQTTSGVMRESGKPEVRWFVFDKWDEPKQYIYRAHAAKTICNNCDEINVRWLPHLLVTSYDQMIYIEDKFVERGFEGAMLRCPDAKYKQGRSTLKQEWLVKVKRFVDSEAEVIGTYELMHNDNEATIDETGYTKRSTHKAGKTNAGTLGGLIAIDCNPNHEFYKCEIEVGTGFTAEQRANLWAGRNYLPGKIITYKYFPRGCKDKPRHPIFKAFRDARD